MEHIVLMLFGVSEEKARGKVVGALNTVPGVKEVQVNMYRDEARTSRDGRCAPRAIEETIRAVGFTGQWVGAYHAVLPDAANKNPALHGDTL